MSEITPQLQETAIEKAVRIAGGQSALAAEIGGKVRQGYVWKWLKAGRVPPPYVLAVERATGVPRHELRPDIYPLEEAA